VITKPTPTSDALYDAIIKIKDDNDFVSWVLSCAVYEQDQRLLLELIHSRPDIDSSTIVRACYNIAQKRGLLVE